MSFIKVIDLNVTASDSNANQESYIHSASQNELALMGGITTEGCIILPRVFKIPTK